MTKRCLTLLLLAAVVLLGTACSRSSQENAGVVATVNGKPITLAMLEFQYDILHFDSYAGTLPTVGSLREAYGQILGSLIAQELVSQDLEKRGQQVSDKELAEAEATIRADYPDDTFEKMLADEFIDLDMWRKHLRYVCAMEKFQRLVLRPSVHIDYREAEAYYQEHLADFKLPERVRLFVVRAQTKEAVERAVAFYRNHKGATGLDAAVPEAQAREVTVPKALLSIPWADSLHNTDIGQAGAIMTDKFGYECLVLLERLAPHALSPEEAYPQVEAALVERRMLDAFEAWLSKAVEGSVIKVSERLLHKQEDEDLPPETSPEDSGNGTIASGNETG